MENAHTKKELEDRLMVREKKFGEVLIALQPPTPKLPGKVSKGILAVPVAEINKYIATEKANAAHAAIHAFLETTFEEFEN